MSKLFYCQEKNSINLSIVLLVFVVYILNYEYIVIKIVVNILMNYSIIYIIMLVNY